MIKTSQETVIEVLKQHKHEWLTSKEIAAMLDQQVPSVVANLKRLRGSQFVLWRCINNRLLIYKHKN